MDKHGGYAIWWSGINYANFLSSKLLGKGNHPHCRLRGYYSKKWEKYYRSVMTIDQFTGLPFYQLKTSNLIVFEKYSSQYDIIHKR